MSILPKRISTRLIEDLAEKAVRKYALKKLGGKTKKRRAVREVARKLDKMMKWPRTPLGLAAELLDGPLFLLVGCIVEDVYHRIRNELRS